MLTITDIIYDSYHWWPSFRMDSFFSLKILRVEHNESALVYWWVNIQAEGRQF